MTKTELRTIKQIVEKKRIERKEKREISKKRTREFKERLAVKMDKNCLQLIV